MTRCHALSLAAVLCCLSLAGCSEEKVCSGDMTLCGGTCKLLAADPQNCGACGNVCAEWQTCSAGQCQAGTAQADLFLACFNTNEVRTATRDLVLAGPPAELTAGPGGFAWLSGDLFVAAAGNGGAEQVAHLAGTASSLHADPIWTSNATPDLEYLAEHGGHLYASHNSLKSLLVLSPSGAVVEEYPLAGANDPNPNPLGIAFSGDRAYVALNTSNEVAVLDVSAVGSCASPGSCIHEVARVDVQPLASAGAKAMPARIAVVGGRAFVTLWNLDASFNPPAGSTGRLAVIDLATNQLDASANTSGPAGLVDLGASCLNPADVAVSGSTLYVSCGAFDYSNFPEVRIFSQGIVPVDLSDPASAPVPHVKPILPAPADAAPGKLAFCSERSYVADRNTGRVFRLDPSDGAVDGAVLCPVGTGGFAYVADIACGF